MPEQKSNSPFLRMVITFAVVFVAMMVIISQMSDRTEDGAEDSQEQAQAEPGAEEGSGSNPGEEDAGDGDSGEAGEEPDEPESEDPDEPDTSSEGEGEDTPETTAEGEGEGETAEEEGTEAEQDDTPGPLDNLRAVYAPVLESDSPDTTLHLTTIGSRAEDSEDLIVARINHYRACIHDVTFTQVYTEAVGDEPYTVLPPLDLSPEDAPGTAVLGTYAADYIEINGTRVVLWERDEEAGRWLGNWKLESDSADSATFSLTIVGGPEGEPVPVARITRTYQIEAGSYTVQLVQRVTNLLDEAGVEEDLSVVWRQFAQTDVHYAANDYLRGRSRQYVLGYFDNDYDPSHLGVYVTDDAFIPQPELVKDLEDPNDNNGWSSIWPNPQIDEHETKELVWLAADNRFFAVILSARTPADTAETGDVRSLQSVYPTITTDIYPNAIDEPSLDATDRHVLIKLTSTELTIAPGQSSAVDDLSLDLYVGPREDAAFAQAPYNVMGFEKTIRYSLGGMCGCCTFQWLADLLLSLLHLLHRITFDWGIAIILLVLIVRLCLHPLTKKGQTAMMKMSKQMAAVQPEMDKLKKKFADDPRAMQQAQMQLFREKGINPAAGMVGCLPMLLQMPIWIALYAMLYYVFELRHQPAFYGLFQNIAGWPFLADLSSADRFIPLLPNDGTNTVNLIFIVFDYSSINILPILMGVTFYINMKYTTPPPMNEQQATQQKIMKIMPLIFPFFLYSAPAALTLYICASTFAGIIDSRIVRKHVKELEESGELFKPKERKPGGFMDRLQKAAELRMEQMEEAKKQQQQGKNKGPQGYKKRRKK